MKKDAVAVSLGYVADASRVDKAKYPNYAAGQACSGCTLFQGRSRSRSGRLPPVCRKASQRQGLVQRIRQESGLTQGMIGYNPRRG